MSCKSDLMISIYRPGGRRTLLLPLHPHSSPHQGSLVSRDPPSLVVNFSMSPFYTLLMPTETPEILPPPSWCLIITGKKTRKTEQNKQIGHRLTFIDIVQEFKDAVFIFSVQSSFAVYRLYRVDSFHHI